MIRFMYLGTRIAMHNHKEKKLQHINDVIYDQLQERTKENQQLDKTQRIKTQSCKLNSDAKLK